VGNRTSKGNLKEGKIIGAENKPKASVFIDYRNYHYYLEKYKWNIDWGKFKMFLSSMYNINKIYFYEGVPSKIVFFDLYPASSLEDFVNMRQEKNQEFKSLEEKGFAIRKKLVNRIYDAKEKKYKHKCNFDVELTIDAVDNLDDYEVCILCSGDGDFVKLIRYLKGKHKTVIVIAGKDRLSSLLKKAAHQFMYLKNMKPNIMKPQSGS